MTMLTIGLALAALAQAPAPQTHCAGHEANLKTYLDISRILFNELQAERASEFYADEFINHNSDAGGSDTSIGRPATMAAMWAATRRNDPGRELINNLIICKDDLVVAQVTLRGSRAGETLVDKPEGRRRYSTTAIDMYRFKDGKVVERWGNSDLITVIRQLGMPTDLTLKPLPPE
jgi:predicted SnoaL-like aldol condensation-catalyzing enzyme